MKTPNCLGRDYIQADYQNGEVILSALGSTASKYLYTRELRDRVMQCYESALRSSNRCFVLRGSEVIAAQSTREGARSFAQSGDVIFELTHDDVCNELFRRLDALKDDARMPVLRLLKHACNIRLGMQVKRGDPVPTPIPDEIAQL